MERPRQEHRAAARVFPWAVGYGLQSDLWAKLGYEREVKGGIVHQEKWVEWRQQAAADMPPWRPPKEAYADAFYEANLRPLLWIPACAPANASSRADATPPPNTVRGMPLGLVSPRPLRPGRLMVAPSWLASLGDDPEPDWAASDPPGFAYLHLTNMWHCFPHVLEQGRPALLAARARLLGPAARRPGDHAARQAVRRRDARAAAARGRLRGGRGRGAARPAEGGARASSPAGLAFRRLQALVHNLVLLAALLGRKPVMPLVPCELIRAIQPVLGVPVARSRFGVSHPSVVTTGRAGQEMCHLSPGVAPRRARPVLPLLGDALVRL